MVTFQWFVSISIITFFWSEEVQHSNWCYSEIWRRIGWKTWVPSVSNWWFFLAWRDFGFALRLPYAFLLDQRYIASWRKHKCMYHHNHNASYPFLMGSASFIVFYPTRWCYWIFSILIRMRGGYWFFTCITIHVRLSPIAGCEWQVFRFVPWDVS